MLDVEVLDKTFAWVADGVAELLKPQVRKVAAAVVLRGGTAGRTR